jgi:glucokinase
MSVLAIDIGGTKFTMALFERAEPERGHPPATARGEQGGARWTMTRRESRATDRTGGPAWMTARIAEIAAVWRKQSEFERIGVGFGGPVHFATQKVVLSTHVGGWEGFDLVEWLRAHFKVPVRMDNDANTGALGEGLYGAGRGCRPLFYMTLSTGIGGGILTEGGVLRGADSYAGEIGHMTIRPGGPECLCGAFGCFERICGGMGLERDHGRPAEALLRDPLFVRRYVVDLALGLKAAIMILNPARLVIGGGIAKAGDSLFVPLREELGRQITAWSKARIDVVPAALGDDSVLWGALALTLAQDSKETEQ